ncbi:glycoside hydrolase family 172 protein [Sabulibacter ruber]|uniref:glycoside hydrolase family 172 protein n=1 Tax=Sabulibacter ruber TaxID=2811901 RepID=UPI001A966362|nr:glycoside hydrolase family 172 protein [Sabulibacter ruber]
MKKLLSVIVFFFGAFLNGYAQNDNYRKELLNLADVSRLPMYRSGTMEQLSSYDRTGGNDDGFSGKYSAIRKEPEGLVMADLKGPGVVNRIWTPTPEVDTVKFYFDGEKTPRISIPFIHLFSGKQHPFVAPLSGSQLGGYYCYLPIPYQKSLKIIYTGKNLRFHQVQYRTLQENEQMGTFTPSLLDQHKDAFEKVRAAWGHQTSPLQLYGDKIKSQKVNLVLRKGAEETLFKLKKGGRIVGIELGAGSDLLQAYQKVLLSARWDNEQKNALELPLHNFFGFAFGKPAMQSMLLGADRNKLYSYLPMPVDRSAELKLKYDKGKAGDPDEILISGTIYYTNDKRDAATEGKLYAQARRQYNIPSAVPHLIANVRGRGHYIGTILQTQGLEEGSTYYFEGDDRAFIDGKLRLHGTGSEDYFNGGWYAVTDKWDKGFSLPIHGALAYDLMTSRTGGYRFYLADKLNFNDSLRLTIEHQPEDKTNVKTDYTSVGLFYADKPQFENSEIRIDDQITKLPERHKLTPQGMVYSLYWLATADYQEPSIVFGLKPSDSWTAKIDIDAVPVAQVSLQGLDNGRYKVYVEHGKTPQGSPFSLWQRSSQISGWIPTNIEIPDQGAKTVYAGEIEITDELKTITLRKRPADVASVRVFSFIFEKIEEKK